MEGGKDTQKDGRAGNMPEISGFTNAKNVKSIDLWELLCALPKAQREKLTSGYDMKSFAKIFEDKGMMQTVEAFLKGGMNVSQTARSMYMHRNTLIYRLNAIRRQTGLDLRDFEMALTFRLLHYLYLIK